MASVDLYCLKILLRLSIGVMYSLVFPIPWTICYNSMVNNFYTAKTDHFFTSGMTVWTGRSERIDVKSNNPAQHLSSIYFQGNSTNKVRGLDIFKGRNIISYDKVIMPLFDHLNLQETFLYGSPGTGNYDYVSGLAPHIPRTPPPPQCASASHLVGKRHGDDAKSLRLLLN